jgi:hypothetical protein
MAFVWLMLEGRVGKRIPHRLNCKERRLPERPEVSAEVLCEQVRNVYEFPGCYWHGHT